MSKPNWDKIKAEYISGKSREEICEKYGLPYDTLGSRIKKGKWKAKQTEAKLKADQKFVEKISETLAERQAKCLAEQEGHADFLIRTALKEFETEVMAIKTIPDMLKSRSVVSAVELLSKTIERAYKLKRNSLGMKDEVVSGSVKIVFGSEEASL